MIIRSKEFTIGLVAGLVLGLMAGAITGAYFAWDRVEYWRLSSVAWEDLADRSIDAAERCVERLKKQY